MLKAGPMRPEHWNALLDVVKSLRLEAGPGIRATRTSYGTTISAMAGDRRSPAVRRHPFQLLDASTPEARQIRVRYGTLAGEAPEGFNLGDQPPFVLELPGDTGRIYAHIQLSEDLVTYEKREILATQDALPPDTEYDAHLELGSWSTEDSTGRLSIAQSIECSLSHHRCGFTHLWSGIY